jgi:DNA-binding protein WhiA
LYFSPLVKQELARIIPSKDSEQKSELLAFIVMNGRIDSQGALSIFLDNPVMIKVVYFLIKRAFQYEAKIDIIRKNNKRKIYYITVNDTEKTISILEQLGLARNDRGDFVRSDLMRKKEDITIENHFCDKSFLRGAFLAGGFVNDPERMYHLEIACPSKEIAQIIKGVLHHFSFSAKISFWQKEWTVYIKKSEEIFEFLRFIGVQRALLNLQDIIARKDLLNTVNRLVNCETANLDKTIVAASRQLFCIDIIAKKVGLENLSPNIREVTKARLKHPYASIQELADIIGNGITKSGVSHRLKKIEQIAEEYLAVDET